MSKENVAYLKVVPTNGKPKYVKVTKDEVLVLTPHRNELKNAKAIPQHYQAFPSSKEEFNEVIDNMAKTLSSIREELLGAK